MARLYTVFEARLFASGASQIGTLKRLAQAGHRIFHVPMLHAKVLLAGKCATVGSQNLTERGAKKNVEATAVIREPVLVKRVRTEVEDLVSDARPVSLEQITEMERAVPPLRRTFRSFEKTTKEADSVVGDRERARLANDERVRLEAAARAEHLAQILGRTERSRRAVRLDLRRPILGKRSYQTLLCRDPNDDITRWDIADEPVRLVSRSRHLVLMATTGRLAWVAANKTRLTQFGTGLSNTSIEIDGDYVPVAFHAIADDTEANVRFQLRPVAGEPAVVLRAWFDIKSLQLRPQDPDRQDDKAPRAIAWLEHQLDERPDDLAVALAERLLRPFEYKRNRDGEPPSRFVDQSAASFSLRLYRRGEFPFLVLTPLR